MTIQVYAVEKRVRMIPGQKPETIVRETILKDGKGRATVRVLRGKRTMSSVTQKLNLSQKRRITRRKYVKGLYKPQEQQVLRELN
jgi:hypothetical protein